MKSKKRRQIALVATPDEIRKIELIMRHFRRNSYSDTMRMLISAASEKILTKSNAMTIDEEC